LLYSFGDIKTALRKKRRFFFRLCAFALCSAIVDSIYTLEFQNWPTEKFPIGFNQLQNWHGNCIDCALAPQFQ
jgi:hypothetical protein